MAVRLSGITIDCAHPIELAEFWAALLGGEVSEPLPGWRRLGAVGSSAPVLNFQPVPEPKVAKSRIHLDLTADDMDAAVARVLDLGGSWAGERHDYGEGTVRVVADPEGHEFCLVQYFRLDG